MKRSERRKAESGGAARGGFDGVSSERAGADTEVARAKLFWNGRSQAVRLPRAFRFEGDEVSVRREGEAVILEPVRKRDWPPEYWDRLRELTRDFDFPDVEPLGGGLLDVRLDGV